ncbi:ferrous iron transport protein A [Coprothermobacteraceae bacterium]|nr:ferrous iron transport protein A [Coprothermobacteraceae bacterium]
MQTLNVKLQDLAEGASGKIRFIAGPPWFRQRMYELGLLPGVQVKLVKRAPLGGPIVVEFLTQRLALSPKEANWIHVDVV